jgi:hypothetical protein
MEHRSSGCFLTILLVVDHYFNKLFACLFADFCYIFMIIMLFLFLQPFEGKFFSSKKNVASLKFEELKSEKFEKVKSFCGACKSRFF